jgi:cardiolipin synthase (CMP-forming)
LPLTTQIGGIPLTTRIGITLLWLSALLTLYTGWDYLRAGWRHVMEEEGG